MSNPNSVILATGYSADICYAKEGVSGSAGYGIPSTVAGDYKWAGLIYDLTGTIDQKQIIFYRMDGVSRYPQYVVQGGREVSLEINYTPQDNNILDDMVNNVTTTSHTFYVVFKNSSATYGTSTYPSFVFTGCRADSVKVHAAAGEKFTVTVNYMCQDVYQGELAAFPSLSGLPGDTDKIPYFFANQSISLNSILMTRALTLDLTVENNVERVFQFGKPVIRAAPAKAGNVTGTIEATFSTATDFNNVYGVATLSGNIPANATAGGGSTPVDYPVYSLFNVGPFVMIIDTVQGKTMTMSNVAFVKIPIPAKPEDLVKVNMDFQAYGQPAIVFN